MSEEHEEHPATRNHRFWLDEAGKVKSVLLSPEELTALRARVEGKQIAIRSCWQCNSAHRHFLKGDWGDWVCFCLMGCGAYYFDKADITDWSEEGDRG